MANKFIFLNHSFEDPKQDKWNIEIRYFEKCVSKSMWLLSYKSDFACIHAQLTPSLVHELNYKNWSCKVIWPLLSDHRM